MKRVVALVTALLLAGFAQAQGDPAADARAAAQQLEQASVALQEAVEARGRAWRDA